MSTITFTQLHCLRKQDVIGKDEPRLFVDGVDVWNGVISKEERKPVNRTRQFDGAVTVVLKEDNPPNKSKTLGTVTIRKGDVGPAVFKTSGAHYELYYSIRM